MPASMPPCTGESFSATAKGATPSTTPIPITAVKPIAALTSLPSASIAGATAAIAELPHMALPQATSIAILSERPSARPILYPTAIVRAIVPAIAAINATPVWASTPRLVEAPIRATAASMTGLAAMRMPVWAWSGKGRLVRTKAPARMASTRASSQAWPQTAISHRSSPKASKAIAAHKARPGNARFAVKNAVMPPQ